jgi:excisionase family DNA binding protein
VDACVAGATGFEPVAFGFGVGHPADPGVPVASPSFTLRTVASSPTSPNVPPRPLDHGEFAALVLHGSQTLMSPKEAARRLGMKVSTVYRLCAKDALPHVRLGSLLRIDVESYLAAPRRWSRKP